MIIEEEILAFLEELEHISDIQKKIATDFIKNITENVSDISDPYICETDCNTLQFAWDAKRFYLDIDINPDGLIDWFYIDRENRKQFGANKLDKIPDDFISYLIILSSFEKSINS